MATLTVYSAPGSVVPTTGFWTRARKAGATFVGLGVLAAVLFGALHAGGNRMQSYSHIALDLVTVLQAVIVIFIAAPALVKAIFRLRAARAGGAPTSLAKGW